MRTEEKNTGAQPLERNPEPVTDQSTARVKKSDRVITRLYTETDAGGFAHVDQRPLFFLRVNALLKPDMVLLDLGAGRGKIAKSQPSFLRDMSIFKGRCAKVYGADVDPVIFQNPTLDEALLIQGSRIPLPDASVDLIISSATFEHIAQPREMADEIKRILRPGGWLCAWTVSKFGYVALGAQLIPNRLHSAMVRLLEPQGRKSRDVFPTVYRLNTLSAIRRFFPADAFAHHSYYLPGVPSYNAGSLMIGRILNLYNMHVPGVLKKNFHIFLKKI